MLSWGYGPRPFPFDLICCLSRELAYNCSTFSGQLSQCRNTMWISIEQFLLPSVPFRQQLMGRSCSNDAWVRQACQSYMWDLPRSSITALKVPNGFMRLREVVGEEATTIFSGKDASETPEGFPQSTDVQYVHFQQISWLGALDMDRSTQIMNLIQVAAGYVVGVVVVFDLSACPVQTLQPEDFPLDDSCHFGDIGMPTIVQGYWLVFRSFGQVYLDESARRSQDYTSEGGKEQS